MSNFTTLERTMSERDPRRVSQTPMPQKVKKGLGAVLVSSKSS